MQHHLSQPRAYRERADECPKLAEVAPVSMRKGYLLLAESYDRLANEAEPSPDETRK
jgi:hypothetical protein